MKKYIREPFSSLSHLFGAVLSVVALLYLLEKSGDSLRALIASTLYGLSLILLYVASALTHGLHACEKTLSRIERFDHAAIFFLIAGTYTPVCLLLIRGSLGWALLISEWILAAIGVYSIFHRKELPRGTKVVIYLAMGWLFLIALDPIVTAVPNIYLAWLIAGGLFYSVGTIFFLTNKPNLWRGHFEAHDLWHVFVLSGSACHFIFIDSFFVAL